MIQAFGMRLTQHGEKGKSMVHKQLSDTYPYIHIHMATSINLCPGRYRWKHGQTVRVFQMLENLKCVTGNTTFDVRLLFPVFLRKDSGNRPVSLYTNIIVHN